MASDQTKELFDKLEQGIKDTMNSEKFKEYLKFQSNFHNYSINNTFLILLQKPDAAMVAGFKSWQKLGRNVLKGEKSIKILAPSPFKKEVLVDKIDPKSGKPVLDNTGSPIQEKTTIQKMSFKPVSVFDVGQTDGKEIPTLCNELKGNSLEASKIVSAIKSFCEIPIVEENIPSGAKGYFSHAENKIAVQEGMSLEQTAKTLIHEYAHYQLHSNKDISLDRATKEVQAESVAFIVSNKFGVDTSEYSFDYVASWSSGKELSELKSSLDIIQKASNSIITKLEQAMSKDLALERDNKVMIKIEWSEDAAFKSGQRLTFDEANEIFKQRQQDHTDLIVKNNIKPPEAGLSPDYIPYLKTKFILELPSGREFTGRFDIGDGQYKDLYECAKSECHVDVSKYMDQISPSIQGQVISQFQNEFPSIKHISENSAKVIHQLVENKGLSSIKDIKEHYKALGSDVEKNFNQGDYNSTTLKEFKELKGVINELKQCSLKELNQSASNSPVKVQSMEIGG